MSKARCIACFAVLTVLLLILTAISLMTGSVSIPIGEVIDILGGGGTDEMSRNIIMSIRLPRIVAAIVLGGALSLSGYLLQTFFNNPIVGPYVLGVSSGAKLTVALALIYSLSKGVVMNSFLMVFAAFCGSMISMGFVLLVSVRVRSAGVLVVCGIMIGYICSAITDFVVTFADDSNIVNLHNWSMGSLSGMNREKVVIMSLIVGVCLILAFFMVKPIGAYRLGESYARNMGVNVTLLRVVLILLASLLAACVTAFAGPVSFVGIAVPHLMRLMSKTSAPIIMIPLCFLGGAVVMGLCDMIARSVFAPVEVSISSVTAVLLVPVVLMMLLKRRSGSGGV